MCEAVYCAPGNGGIVRSAECVDIPSKDTDALVRFASENGIAFTFSCSHVPLQNDIAAKFEANGLKILAPYAETVRSLVHGDRVRALCEDAGIAFDPSAKGPVHRFVCIADGTNILPFPQVISYDTLFDNNEGPSCDSMGALCGPGMPGIPRDRLMNEIVKPLAKAIRKNGIVLSGLVCIRVGADGGKLFFRGFDMHIPGAQMAVILERMESDFLRLMLAASDGMLAASTVSYSKNCAVSVVVICSQRVTEPQKLDLPSQSGLRIYHSSTSLTGEELYTSGRKIVCLCAGARKPADARKAVYEAVGKISFPGMYFRSDIARDVLADLKKQ